MRTATALCALAVMAGCATSPRSTTPPRDPVAVNTATPVCSSKLQCEQMWIDSQTWLENLTRMRLRVVTDSRLETYPATTFGRMSGMALKYPIAPETYEIRAQFFGYGRSVDEQDLANSATNLFNSMVGKTKLGGKQ